MVLLYYIYDGYGRLLWLFEKLRRPNATIAEFSDHEWPSVTVILPVFNEEASLSDKLEDLFRQEYPNNRISILVVDDGSTDTSSKIAESYAHRGVTLLQTEGRVGKSLAQNLAVKKARGEILVLTDVAVRMSSDCILELVKPFADSGVGCVTARLSFGAETVSQVGKDQGRYWKYELYLRQVESSLGWLAVTAGPAMAVRRDLWRDLESRYGDDCMIPLDIVLQGKRVLQAEKAEAQDEYFSSLTQEFRARVRMTVRNWGGTFSRRTLLNPLKYPQYAFALWSHKVLRWLSPVFIIAFVVGCAMIWYYAGIAWPVVSALALIVVSFVGVGAQLMGRPLPLLSTLGNFAIVNAGFALGLIRVMGNRYIHVYSNK
jgi:cellulose synthase/poly-beta-1,6-N-acetylglucosamine synthase-like glycosyltransferase